MRFVPTIHLRDCLNGSPEIHKSGFGYRDCDPCRKPANCERHFWFQAVWFSTFVPLFRAINWLSAGHRHRHEVIHIPTSLDSTT